MEPQAAPSTPSQSEAHFVSRQPYLPPTASFVPLKLEERLAGCSKQDSISCPTVEYSIVIGRASRLSSLY